MHMLHVRTGITDFGNNVLAIKQKIMQVIQVLG